MATDGDHDDDGGEILKYNHGNVKLEDQEVGITMLAIAMENLLMASRWCLLRCAFSLREIMVVTLHQVRAMFFLFEALFKNITEHRRAKRGSNYRRRMCK